MTGGPRPTIHAPAHAAKPAAHAPLRCADYPRKAYGGAYWELIPAGDGSGAVTARVYSKDGVAEKPGLSVAAAEAFVRAEMTKHKEA